MMKLILILTTFCLCATEAFACRQSALLRSKKMVDAVLIDVVKTYHSTGGGGISAIKLVATDVFSVSIE